MFASSRDGWLYGDGPELYAIHDGGVHWRAISLGGSIWSMATGGGTAYAGTITSLVASYGAARSLPARGPGPGP